MILNEEVILIIYTVTCNPSLDYHMQIERIKIGETNRSTVESIKLGGKGINVSVVLKELGFESILLGFLGGFVGDEINRLIKKQELSSKMIRLSQGNSRINVKVKGNMETEFNAAGPLILNEELRQFYEQIMLLEENDVLVLSGSIPSSLSSHMYETILSVVSERHVLCVVDTSGESLIHTLPYHPFLIKPNVYELEEIFQSRMMQKEEIVEAGRKLQEMGARNVLISRGKRGAILIDEHGNSYDHPGLLGESISSVGAGDSMVAGFLAGYLKCNHYLEAFKMALACGSATAFCQDLAKYDIIKQCYEEIEESIK